MANGQTLYQAPQSNLQNLAMQYTQGMAQVNQIKGQVRAARAEELANLGAELDKISLTGLNDADKMFNEWDDKRDKEIKEYEHLIEYGEYDKV